MSVIVEASAIIPAPPQAVYDLLADYHVGHPSILPKPAFVSLTVEEGGVGEGTVFRADMKVMGQSSFFRAKVTEPEPGKLLRETDLDSGTVTDFIVKPTSDGQTQLSFHTTYQTKNFIEKLMIPSLLKRMYKQELGNIAEHFKK
ncbi:MAG TPA: SRPBCC family protein [Aggregatilineales bacterium]|nr:SRPBCC family protein [Aggregatilineales bacterium]